MLLFLAFLIVTFNLQPVGTAGTDVFSCVFPFVFDGRTYSSCTKDGAIDEQFWCGTTPNYDRDGQWKHCSLQEHGGSSGGQPCIFPFVYKNQTYYTCTEEEKGGFWCATTRNYDKDHKWSYCADIRLDASPKGPCVFPFIYNQASYSSCTMDGMSNKKPWCSLTNNYDTDLQWTYCEPSDPVPDPQESSEPDPNIKSPSCVFPFIYKGVSHKACTSEGRTDGKLWCATSHNYDVDKKWVYCNVTGELDADPRERCVFPFVYNYEFYFSCTTDGMSGMRSWCSLTTNYNADLQWTYCESIAPGEAMESPPCTFPFIYEGRIYKNCTTDGQINGTLWCATTSNYDVDKKWKFCPDHREAVREEISPFCVFPFIYKGNIYNACTTDGMSDGKLWCANTSNYDVDKQWVYCNATEEADPMSLCVFPFIYNHNIYLSCTTDGMSGRKPWCSLTMNYNKDLQWTYCEPTGPGETRERPPCIFPFTYKGKVYNNCTGDGRRDRRPWCATTDSYDMDSKGKFCQVSGPDPNLQSPTCAFPFIYKGNFYNTCITEGMRDGKHWCATTSSYDLDERWMYCNVTGPDPSIEGPSCTFPFIFKGKSYSMCTTEGKSDGKHWCATTSNYDMDKKWKYCNVTGPNESVESPQCVFPFLYEGKFYLSCTADGRTDGRLWCATSNNYNADKRWKFCQEDSVPRPCVFPFIYNQKSYTSCTKDGNIQLKLWCATTANYDRDKKWKNCAPYEYGGNSGGKNCTFPFVYRKRIFYTCTNEDALFGRFWCSTTGSYDKNRRWSYCADTRLAANSQGPCIFPFTYNFKSYSTCTTDGEPSGRLWCSLSSNYDVDLKRAYCELSEARPCIFPFIFNKKSYSACTTEGSSDGQLWCATTANYDIDSQWKQCSLQEYEGSSKGQPCVFPFFAEKQTFYTCTNVPAKNGRYWCATTGSYDKDDEWSYCADTRLDASPKGPCVFPFIYNGTSYSSCTKDGEPKGRLWCSLTKNYDADLKRTYCDPSEFLPCHFPFIWRGISYSACTKEGSTDDQLWCATTPNYDKVTKWKACSLQEYEGSSGGQPCAFPFIYRNRTFFTCTNESSKDGRFWCATTGDYDKDKLWSYCADTRLDAKPKGACAFPFIYRGKTYSTCITEGEITGKLWCSLTSNYDVDSKWTFCEYLDNKTKDVR